MNVDKLIKILETQTNTYHQFRMFALIVREISSIPECRYYVNNGNIYITKGEACSYPCIVAHMDTVHAIGLDLKALRVGNLLTGFNRITMKQAGIGGDDKVGIFIALECLQKFNDIKVAFFRDEETGCEGSYEADVSFFENCNFIIQCDRMGNGDFITNASGVSLSSYEFQTATGPIIERFGYSFTHGLMTDVMALKELEVSCSMANISCGYYNPHTDYEVVNTVDVENCMLLVTQILQELGQQYFPHYYRKSIGIINYSKKNKCSAPQYCMYCFLSDTDGNSYCETCNEYSNLTDYNH
jgi:tripeptide aminopeptidase